MSVDTTEVVPVMEYKCLSITGFKADEQDEGVIETFVSVTGLLDNVKDVIKPGAYEKSLAVRTPKGVWHHQWHESISRTEAIKELLPGDPGLPTELPNGQPWPKEAGALYVKTRFNLETQRGREAYADVKFFGADQEWSIGYNVPVGGATTDSKTGVRTIHYLDLYEYSPVLFGAMPAARTSSVKDAQMSYKSLMNEEPVAAVTVEDEGQSQPDDVVIEGENPPDGIAIPEEKNLRYFDEGEEGRVFGYLQSDGVFVKSQVSIAPAQAAKLHRAARALLDLLHDVNIMEEDPTPNGLEEEPNLDEDQGAGSLTELVDDLEDEDVRVAAEEFDDAIRDGDGAAAEEAAEVIVSAIEALIEEGADAADYADIGAYIANAFTELPDDEDSAANDTETDATQKATRSGPGKKQLDLDSADVKVIDIASLEDVLS